MGEGEPGHRRRPHGQQAARRHLQRRARRQRGALVEERGQMKPSMLLALWLASGAGAAPLSHPPMRPLPKPSVRPLGSENLRYADAGKGDDGNDGSRDKPWKTVRHALTRLKPGDTLLLRGGTYYETLIV